MNNNPGGSRSTQLAKEIVFMGIMIALDVIAVRFLSLTTPVMRIGTGFIAVIIAGMYLGPVRAGIVGLIADLIGFMLFPVGAFFPGFTLSATVSGVLAGYFLEGKKSGDFKNVIIYAVFSTLLVDTLMNTTWLVMMLHQGDFTKFLIRLIPRIPNQVVITVLKIVLIPLLYSRLFKRFRIAGVEHPGIREANQ